MAGLWRCGGPRVVVMAIALAGAAFGAGCGGQARPPARAPRALPLGSRLTMASTAPPRSDTALPGPSGPQLVFFKRVEGADPLADQLTIDTHGRAAALTTLGGIDGEKKHTFRLSPRGLAHLRELLRDTHLHDTWCCSDRTYVYWVMNDGHAWRLQEGRVPSSTRPLVDMLDRLTSANTSY